MNQYYIVFIFIDGRLFTQKTRRKVAMFCVDEMKFFRGLLH